MIPEYRNQRFDNATGDVIWCEINLPQYNGWVPYVCYQVLDSRDDFSNPDLFAAMAADPTTQQYVPPAPIDIAAQKALEIRAQRDNILSSMVDPYVSNPLRWADLPITTQTAIKTYRQQLLDITLQTSFPDSVVWPTPPLI